MAPASLLLVVLALAGVIQASPFPRSEIINYQIDDEFETPSTLNDYRIPTVTVPRHYVVRISPDFASGNFGYDGQVTINIAATQAGVNVITLQSQDLTVISVTVTPVAGGNNILTSFTYDTTYNNLYLNLNSALEYNANSEQLYTVYIVFQGTMRTDMYGFYRSWYTHNGAIRWMGTTQFQATSARAAFPCYDEPSFKATFDIVIERPATYSSWSNMRLQSSALIAATGRYVDTFYTTPVMSTYLLAFIVAEYDTLPVYNAQNQLTYEVIARPNAIATGQGAYSLDVGQRLLAAMDSHTGINFADMDPNIKMTQASIPDFSAGAMENWGLLTYREAYLMYHPEHTNSRLQQLIAYILSHEIAHMWFGNLVTCEWWDYLWLNEGFARYYQYFLTHWVETEMGFDIRFIVEQVHTSLLSDSTAAAHPLTSPVDSPASVSGHFSTITYNKGAAIIRMTEHLLGFDVNRQGLENYLRARSYSTAVPSDLFSALDAVGASSGALAQYGVGFTIDEYYRSWTEQAGYPLIFVKVDHDTGSITLEQRRFDRDVGYSSTNTRWVIPITFATASSADFSDTKPTHIIRDTITVINRGSVGDEWVILNKQQTGYYRVNYDDYTWGLITLALRGDQRTLIHEFNRAQIVDDVLQLARAGLMSYNRAFNILSFLENETDYAPWVAAITGFSYLERRFAGTDQLARIQAMFIGWSTTVMNQLTYYPIAGESWMRSYLRSQLAPVMCRYNVAACRAAATAQLAALQATPSVEVPVDSRAWVYCNGLRDGSAADWTFLWNRFQNHNVYTEKIILIENLGCTSEVTSVATFLNAITTENFIVRPQDYASAMNSVIVGNEANTLIVLNWIQNNFAQYQAAFPNVAGYLNTLAARLTNENDIQAYETWINNNQNLFTAAVLTSLQNGIASTRQLISWTNSITAEIVEYLDNGFQTVELTTAGPEPITEAPSTVLPPAIAAPVIPEYSGAASLASSFATVLLAAVAGLVACRA